MKCSLERRSFLKSGTAGVAGLALSTLFERGTTPTAMAQTNLPKPQGHTMTSEWQQTLTPEEIIALGKAGNQRFVKGQVTERD
jgi:hypothetical protein